MVNNKTQTANTSGKVDRDIVFQMFLDDIVSVVVVSYLFPLFIYSSESNMNVALLLLISIIVLQTVSCAPSHLCQGVTNQRITKKVNYQDKRLKQKLPLLDHLKLCSASEFLFNANYNFSERSFILAVTFVECHSDHLIFLECRMNITVIK